MNGAARATPGGGGEDIERLRAVLSQITPTFLVDDFNPLPSVVEVLEAGEDGDGDGDGGDGDGAAKKTKNASCGKVVKI